MWDEERENNADMVDNAAEPPTQMIDKVDLEEGQKQIIKK